MMNCHTLFPTDLPELEWCTFDAEGYTAPVSGVLYSADNPATCGMPLGGIDTGCIDFETNGLLGFVTAFNSLSPRRGPLNVPFLGLKLDGRVHLLAGAGQPGAIPARQVRYWGHYPIADAEFELDCPISAGVRAWSPFIPGDVKASMIPGAVFEVHLRNQSDQPLTGTLAASFPGFERHYTTIHRKRVMGPFNGAIAGHGWPDHPQPDEASYALGVIGDEFIGDEYIGNGNSGDQYNGDAPVHFGYHFGWNASAWLTMDNPPTPPMSKDDDNSGMSIAIDFSLAPHGSQVIRFVLAWYAPMWYSNGTRAAGGNAYRHMYARNFTSAHEVATYLVTHHETLLRRILAWQQVVYSDAHLPAWLSDSLINILHLITEDSVWAQAQPPIGDWCKPADGLFGLNECPRGCPQIECLPCSFYGNLPVVYFFPEAALSTLRGYKAYQFEDGRPAWVFGGVTATANGFYEMAQPHQGYQQSLNGCCVVEVVDKLWLRTGDEELLREMYDLCKRATLYTLTLRPDYGDEQVISMPKGNAGTEWFEAPEPGWAGMATHLGGIRLAHVLMMKRMAAHVGDDAFVAQCQHWLDAGSRALETHLWSGTYYLNFLEPETGKKSDLVFGYQLDGQWIARFHGDPAVMPESRVRATLDTIKRCNIALSASGAVNYANADGSPAAVGGYGTYSYFPPELLMLAMTYMYHGERDFGLWLAQRCWENIVCKQRLTWDQPNFFRGGLDSGERDFGNDYYQNMMLWSLPAAMEGQALHTPCAPGGLIDRIIQAGKQ